MNYLKIATNWILALLLLVPIGAGAESIPLRCLQTKMHDQAPKETAQFEFLVGDFSLTLHAWRNDAWTPPRPVNARWNGWYGLNGMAIVDEWYDPDPASNPSANSGINVRMYDPEEKIWKMMWISTAAKQVQDLRAQMIDGVLTMWQVSPPRPEFKATFEVTDADHWARISYVPDEKEGEWVPQFKLAASRIPCGE